MAQQERPVAPETIAAAQRSVAGASVDPEAAVAVSGSVTGASCCPKEAAMARLLQGARSVPAFLSGFGSFFGPTTAIYVLETVQC